MRIGSKVRVMQRTSDAMGVEIPPYTATIIGISKDEKGTILQVQETRAAHARDVRPEMVKRRRLKAVA